jgi:hypothetical protein
MENLNKALHLAKTNADKKTINHAIEKLEQH